MTAKLPGSSSGMTFGLTAAKAGLRLIGGTELADVIADLTGLSARRIKSLAREASRRLQQSGVVEHEYREVPPASHSLVEAAVIDAFRRASARDHQTVPVAALTGVDDLIHAATDPTLRREMADWSRDETAYAVALTREVAGLCRQWYLEDGTARAYATAVGVAHVLKGQDEALAILRQQFAMPRAIQDIAGETLDRKLTEVGWAWTPAPTGVINGVDGFMTPTDEAGAFLPFQIPVRLIRGRIRDGKRGQLLGPFVSREEVEHLRAHVPCGYLITFSENGHDLYAVPAGEVADLLNSTKRDRDHLRMMRSHLVNESTLGAIKRSALADWKHVAEILGTPTLREPALRLFQTLSEAHHVLFEFLAALAFVDPGNLLVVHSQWAQGIATDGRPEDDYLTEVVSTIGEYEVAPPVGLLQGFPAPSLMLAVMRAVVDQLDEIGPALGTDHGRLADQLGLPELRATVTGAIERSYRAQDGAHLSVHTPKHEEARWFVLNAGHCFMSVAQVAVLVDRLVQSVRGVVLSTAPGRRQIPATPTWIRYRSNPAKVAGV